MDIGMSIVKSPVRSIPNIWQPASEDPRAGYLMVVLHGRGDSPEGFESFRDELAIPGLSALLLQAPDPYYTGFSWYELPPDQLPGVERSRGLLEKAFAEIFTAGYVPERTFLMGFSQGCLMTLEFGARFNTRLAGYLGISGYCLDEKKLITDSRPETRTAPWFVTHGDQDDVLPVARTRAQMQALAQAGFRLDYREYRKGHTIDPRRELPDLREWFKSLMK